MFSPGRCLDIICSFRGGGNTFIWTADTGGDLLAKENYGADIAPAAGDTLAVNRNNGNNPITGEFTFSADETPVFYQVKFERAFGNRRSLNPGAGKILRCDYLDIRYSDLFSILSGSYFINKDLGVGNSTSNSDKTYLTIDGGDTYLKAQALEIGFGSASGGRSCAYVTVTNGAVADAQIQVGFNGGAANSLTITGEGTKFYSTNKAVVVGSARVWNNYASKWFYSDDNLLTVDDNAELIASEVKVGSEDGSGNELKVLSGGKVAAAAKLQVGNYSAPATNNVLNVKTGGEVETDAFLMMATNKAVVSGVMNVAKQFVVGVVNNTTGDIGGSEFVVDGGEVNIGRETETVTNRPTFYIGSYQKQSDGNRVVVKNGGKINLTGNYVNIGSAGSGNMLVVTGTGSRFIHDAQTYLRDFVIGLAGVEGIDNGNNAVTVSDGGYVETSAGLQVGSVGAWQMHDITLTVDQGTVKVAEKLRVGMDDNITDAQLMVKGSLSRVSAKTIEVGARSRIVFDLSDAQASEEALVQILNKPTFEEGSRIYITSSDRQISRAAAFDCTLLACGADMDLSNVEIEVDPESELRLVKKGDLKKLTVRGGLRPGTVITVR